jgi:hypothetical protein
MARRIRLRGSTRKQETESDLERQLSFGTYTLGDTAHKLLLADLPCERVLQVGEPPSRLAFCLPGSAVWLQLELLPQEGE